MISLSTVKYAIKWSQDLQYSRSRYTFTVHKTCAESLCEIQHHPLHPHHPLQADCTTLKLVVGREIGFICSGCRHYSFGFGYGCRACDFKLDFQCAFPNLEIQPQLPIRREIKADFHEHKLQHFYHNMLLSAYHPQQLEDIVCSYCSKGINGSAFACIECDLFIHEPCIYKVPHGKQIISPFHLDHPLFLQLSDRQRWCGACSLEFRRGEFFLSCGECSSIFETYHISCGSFVGAGLRLKEHHEKHVMLYVYSASGFVSAPRMCCVCNTGCDSCHAYCCLDCNVFVHLECIPLPRAVKHASHSSYHDHPLILSNSTNLLNFSSNEYHCLVCEKQGNINHLFYHCDQCSDMAHIDCILSEVSLFIIISIIYLRFGKTCSYGFNVCDRRNLHLRYLNT